MLLDLVGVDASLTFPTEREALTSSEREGGSMCPLSGGVSQPSILVRTIPFGGVRERGVVLRGAGFEHAGRVGTFHLC